MNKPFTPARAGVIPFEAKILEEIFRPINAGYTTVYREGADSPPECPGCLRCNWWVGRTLAECAFCSTAIPLQSNVWEPVLNREYRAPAGSPARG